MVEKKASLSSTRPLISCMRLTYSSRNLLTLETMRIGKSRRSRYHGAPELKQRRLAYVENRKQRNDKIMTRPVAFAVKALPGAESFSTARVPLGSQGTSTRQSGKQTFQVDNVITQRWLGTLHTILVSNTDNQMLYPGMTVHGLCKGRCRLRYRLRERE